MSDALLMLRAVAKRYRRDRWVLRNVDVEISRGNTVVVTGSNGAGKSTLLRLLAGVSAPNRGRREARRGLHVGFVPDGVAPPPPLSVRSYLFHHARIRGVASQPIQGSVSAALGLDTCRDTRLGELSKGSLQKVLIVQALIGEPDLLVLDEPFAGLDTGARDALRHELEDRAAAGAAVVVGDHRDDAGRDGARTVWVVSDGEVQVSSGRSMRDSSGGRSGGR